MQVESRAKFGVVDGGGDMSASEKDETWRNENKQVI